MLGDKDIRDFRPISLMSCIYKLIVTVLVRKLSRAIGEVIGVANMHLWKEDSMDAILVTNEVVDDLVDGRKEGLIRKLDMEKAYDHVCWDFINYMLGRMSFG